MKEQSNRILSVRVMADTCSRVMTSHWFTSLTLALLLCWEFGVLLLKAGRVPFWYDELLTFHVSALQPFSLLWKALQAGVDGMPPTYYTIVRLARMLPGDPHVTLRLPSILGYLLTLLGVFWFAQKRLPATAGLAAALLISLSPFRSYALEARSYALMVGFLALSAVLWQRIGERRFMTPLFAVFLTLAASCHYLAVVVISCFGIAEATWTLLSRRIRWGVWAGCLFATVPFFFCLPILVSYRNSFSKTFWSRPHWYTAVSTYITYLAIDFNFALILTVFAGIVIAGTMLQMFRKPEGGAPENDFRLPEIVLYGGFLFYPAVLVILTKLLNSGYTPRYGWPAILGLALGSMYLLRSTWAVSASLLAALLIACAGQGVQDFYDLPKEGSTTMEQRWIRLDALTRGEPDLPVVVGSALNYLEAVQYSPRGLRDRLIEVVDSDQAVRFVGWDTPDRTNRVLAQFIPLQVEDIVPFEAAHRRFILHSGGSSDWFTGYLLTKKYNLKLISADSGSAAYIVER